MLNGAYVVFARKASNIRGSSCLPRRAINFAPKVPEFIRADQINALRGVFDFDLITAVKFYAS